MKTTLKRTLEFICVLIILGLTSPVAIAQSTGKWRNIGPFSASVQCLAIDPQNPEILYAGTSTGVFKSTDGGGSWNKVNSALNVFSLAIDPRTPSTLYASSYGVFKSIDGGENWISASSGLPGLPTLPLVDVGALAIDPQNPDTLYAGTRTGVFKTLDGGASWHATNSGMATFPDGPARPFEGVRRLAIDSQTPNTVYAVGLFPIYVDGQPRCCSHGIFKTTDGGGNWNALTLPDSRPLGLPSFVATLAIDSQNPGTVYASGAFPSTLYKSTDAGASWHTAGFMPVSSLAIAADDSNTLYAGTTKGMFKSTDGGTSWAVAGSGLSIGVGLFILAIDPQDPNTVYAPGAGGLFKTTNGGASWRTVNSGLSTAMIQALAVDPQNSNSIYATGEGLIKTTDAGSNWSGLGIGSPSILAIDPQNPQTIYAANQQSDDRPFGPLFKSIDGGSNWSAGMSGLPVFFVNALVIDSTNPNTIYVGGDRGVFKSSDAAASWTASGLPGAWVFALAIDPRAPGTVYAGSSEGVFRSLDGGVTWNATAFPLNGTVSILAIDPANPKTVYAGAGVGIFKSTDEGTSWTAAGSGLPANPNRIRALIIDPQNPNTLYLGTSGVTFDYYDQTTDCGIPCGGFNDGVFKSTDAGSTWTAVNSGLTTPHVSSLAIDPQNPTRLYAGTIGGGVFAITFGPAPAVTGLQFDRATVVAGTSYSVTMSGSNLSPQTYFDVRFTAPGSNDSDVVLNWQRGYASTQSVPAGTAVGIWTITGVRAHDIETDHTESFVPVSANLTVTP